MQYDEFRRMITKLAWRYTKNPNDVQELVAIGNMAFVKAIEQFDGNPATRSTYMYRCINNAMTDWLRRRRVYRNVVVCNAEFPELMKGLDVEDQILFLNSLCQLSQPTQFMIRDLLLDPLELFRRAKHSSGVWLKKAFKQLMHDYGYTAPSIAFAVEEITNFLKGNK